MALTRPLSGEHPGNPDPSFTGPAAGGEEKKEAPSESRCPLEASVVIVQEQKLPSVLQHSVLLTSQEMMKSRDATSTFVSQSRKVKTRSCFRAPSCVSMCLYVLCFSCLCRNFSGHEAEGDGSSCGVLSAQVEAQGCGAEVSMGEKTWGPAPRRPRRSADLLIESCREDSRQRVNREESVGQKCMRWT
ncbi:uncharacterized protein V6R79_011696 [Siganus canaliculatus]